MKKITLILFLVITVKMGFAQEPVFTLLEAGRMAPETANESRVLSVLEKSSFIKSIRYIQVHTKALDGDILSFQADGQTAIARKNHSGLEEVNTDHSWYGRLQDETGIFFTRMNGQIASKFYLGTTPYLVIPYRNDIHLLITYDKAIDNGICGTPHGKIPVKEASKTTTETQTEAAALSADDNCTLRVLWVVTAQAEPEIPMSLELAARMLQDESNLAYSQSLINYRMEIARVVRTAYVETITNTTATAYGVTSTYPSDLINLSTGAGLLNNIPTLRNTYNADIVVMVRSQATISAQGFYGIAYGIPTGMQTVNAANGFALIATQFMIGGRFTFAHEIGHLQGARHDNHASTPAYARGYVYNAAGNPGRTIMAVGCGINAGTGCRIQYFSNPNITVGGVAIGVADQFDNARRINETALQIKANRLTSTSLLLGAETFDNEILARHLATQTISTNNSAVVALSGSRVSMRAGNSITLLPGFAANSGSVFNGYINTCSYVPTTNRSTVTQAEPAGVQQGSPGLLSDESAAGTLKIIPNPFAGQVQVTYRFAPVQKNAVLEIYSITGTRIWRSTLSAKAPGATEQIIISTTGWAKGSYLLAISTGNEKITRKIVKQ